MPGYSLSSALGESRFAFCALRMRSLFFQRWLVHGQRGSHNRVACCGYPILVGQKTLKHPFTVGDGVLAKLKCVIHAPLLSVLGLRKRDRGPIQGDNNDSMIRCFTEARPFSKIISASCSKLRGGSEIGR